jgi:hypothetical protein
MKNKSLVQLKEYLTVHEQDIAQDINDYGSLAYLFKDVMERSPVIPEPPTHDYRYGQHPADRA